MPLRADIDTIRGEVRSLRTSESDAITIPSLVCFFYRKGSHYRNNCPELLKMILNEVVYLNENRKVCLGKYEKGVQEIWFPSNEISGRDYVHYLINSAKQ